MTFRLFIGGQPVSILESRKTWHILNPLAWWGVWMLLKTDWTHYDPRLQGHVLGQTIPQYDRTIIVPIADPWADFPAPKWTGYPN
jgi:hypothetical protein